MKTRKIILTIIYGLLDENISSLFRTTLKCKSEFQLYFRIFSIRTMKLSKKFSRNWKKSDLRKLEKMENHALKLPKKTIKINSISKMDMILTIQESLSGVTKNKFKGRVPNSKIAAIPFLDLPDCLHSCIYPHRKLKFMTHYDVILLF